MKLLFVLCISLFSVAQAQVAGAAALAAPAAAERPQSNLEKFSEQAGTLFERQFKDLGRVQGARVQILTITNLLKKASFSGVRFEQYVTRSYGGTTVVSFLDTDEVESFLAALNYIKTSVWPSTRETYTEINFKSRGGFEFGCYFNKGKWETWMRVSRYEREAMTIIAPAEVDGLIGLIETANRQLATVKR